MRDSWWNVLGRVAGYAGTAVSVAGLILTSSPTEPASLARHHIALVAVVFFGILLIALDIVTYLFSRPRSYRKDQKINSYMHQWISQEGRVVIFTRDMSWAEGSRIKDLLRGKASRDELSICLPQQIPLTEELLKYGARIYTYERLEYEPQSRFTIVRKGRMDARVAIGRRRDGGPHVIEEFSAGHDPAFHLANDLAEILERLSTSGSVPGAQ